MYTKIITIMIILIISVSCNVFADEIRLKNGDHITGTIIKLDAEKMALKTSYAGEINIVFKEIAGMRTDSPIDVILIDGTKAKGIVSTDSDGNINIKTELIEQPLSFDLAHIKQINPPPPPPAVKLKGRLNIGINITDGNTNTKTYHGDGELIARTKDNRFTLGGRYNRAEDDGETTVNNQTAYMKYDHFLSEKWYFLANVTGTRDKFKDLNLKTSLGVGMGYQFIETETTNLSVEAGPNYVNEDYIDGQDKDFMSARWAVNFDHYLYKDYTQFFCNHVGLISLENAADVSIQSQTGFRFKIYNGFNATTQVNYDWDNNPSLGTEGSDTTYILSLGYQF
ncbi:MAG: DUF481 domain-containing protein [Pseudomonadota bacterium]